MFRNFILFYILLISGSAIGQNSGAISGYIDKGNTVEFVFGDQQNINIGGLDLKLDKWRDQIKEVTLAGDFNGWNPKVKGFELAKVDNKIYKLIVLKSTLGKVGETRQFKFVLNNKYWIEPPKECMNKFKGKDGNANFLIKLN